MAKTLPDWISEIRVLAPIAGRIYDFVSTLYPYLSELEEFAKKPYQFLRKRLLPVLFGGIFELMFGVADTFAGSFAALVSALQSVGAAFVGGPSQTGLLPSLFGAFRGVVIDIVEALRLWSAGAGPLQPWIIGAVAILVGYGGFVVVVRLTRAGLDAIPGLSAVETFIFG